MFKVLSAAALVLASFALKTEVEISHEQTWVDTTNLNDSQQQWDTYFRNTIKAIGDSQVKQVASGANGETLIRYLDTTGNNNETVAWEVTSNGNLNNKNINKIVQVKTTPDPNNANINTITKTTFQNNNLLDVSKQLYAA